MSTVFLHGQRASPSRFRAWKTAKKLVTEARPRKLASVRFLVTGADCYMRAVSSRHFDFPVAFGYMNWARSRADRHVAVGIFREAMGCLRTCTVLLAAALAVHHVRSASASASVYSYCGVADASVARCVCSAGANQELSTSGEVKSVFDPRPTGTLSLNLTSLKEM